MPFIIDGYNLLRVVEKSVDSPEYINDVRLCLVVDRFLSLVYDKGEMIFDGIGPPDKTGFNGLRNLEVVFSGQRREADDVIEDKIVADSAPRRLKVVSSDRRLRSAAKSRKAESIKSEGFWSQIKKELSRKPKVSEPVAKRFGISELETEEWMKLFGFRK